MNEYQLALTNLDTVIKKRSTRSSKTWKRLALHLHQELVKTRKNNLSITDVTNTGQQENPQKKEEKTVKRLDPDLIDSLTQTKIHLNAVFEAVKLPASIADLNTGLTNVNRNALSHFLSKHKDQQILKEEKNRKQRQLELMLRVGGVYQDAYEISGVSF